MSVYIFLALGGIHRPNSSTFTLNMRAALKCQYSCIKIIIENTIIAITIQINTNIYFFCYKIFFSIIYFF